MSVRGPNNVGRAVQTDPTLLHYASAITGQNTCWELLAEKFDRFRTLRNNIQQYATERNIVGQQLSAFLDVTCCVRLHTLLHVLACCCGKFETGQTFQPTTPNISFVP